MRTTLAMVGVAVLVACSACTSTIDRSFDIPVCGSGPYVAGHTEVKMHSISGGDVTLEDAVGTASSCPGTDIHPAAAALYTKDEPFALRWEHPWALPVISPEERHDADFSTEVILPSIIFKGMFPGFGPEETALLVNIDVPRPIPRAIAMNQCTSKEGVVVEVLNHPEARIVYLTDDLVPAPKPDARGTSANGMVAVMGLPDGVFVTVAGRKEGCMVLDATEHFTGRSLIGKGAVSMAWLRLER